ncbi:hypothetical protein PRIPAC_94830, partial [Pristionchus pacificus]
PRTKSSSRCFLLSSSPSPLILAVVRLAMRSLSLLVLLLFAVVVCTAVTPAEMKQLLANGAPQRLRSFNWLYLTDDRPAIYGLNIWAMPKQDWLQDWTIVQISDNEVAIKANRGFYLGHGVEDYAREAQAAHHWQVYNPVKNADGSWSFKSHGSKWLSAHAYYQDYDPKRSYVNFQPESKGCERWFLEPYTPPTPPTVMGELLTNGGKRIFRSFNGMYLTEDYPSKDLWVLVRWDFKNPQTWTIEQMNNNEVAIKSYKNKYIRHGSGDYAREEEVPDKWVMLTPVKNGDGTWSFKSRDDKWLSGHMKYPPNEGETIRYLVNFESENKGCEKWKLE